MSKRSSRVRRGRSSRRPSGIFAADVHVFRFYPDGTVLDVLIKSVPTSADAAVIETWLRKESVVAGVHLTHYTLTTDNCLTFTSTSHFRNCIVEVDGVWSAKRMTLNLREGGRLRRAVRFEKIG
ncbi:hypothetical protein [Nocardia caishijiensis]|uniref:hypothetical protein n=1 Tax=Nocardia caishijiensis TaxID=184756 RepID=UPI0012ED03D2|nr:hypothetical protein [Nocardia caishijiensis]